MENITLTITDGNVDLLGELTRQTIMSIPKETIKQFVSQQGSIVNLKEITRIDTAGLAWLFYILELATTANCQLSFSNIPDKLNKLISLSGVEGFLPIESP